MDVPGLSLFQGAESIKLNTSAQQRIEEEDALEDRLRRNEEVNWLFIKMSGYKSRMDLNGYFDF